MRQGLLIVAFLLLSGCGSPPADVLDPSRSGSIDDSFSVDGWVANQTQIERIALRDPDVIGIQQPGLRILNVTSNTTFRVSAAALTGTANAVRWIAVVPTLSWTNGTAGCAPWDPAWRMRHFLSGIDTLTNQAIPPGNWSLIVFSEKLSNLTLLFNTTTLGPYRTLNGSSMPWTVKFVDADPKIESNNSPYRVTFNKTFQVPHASWVIGQFSLRGDGFTQFREIRSKVEGANGFLCGEQRNEVAQPVTGGAAWQSVLGAQLAGPGTYAYGGRFEATAALNARPAARADVIIFG